MIKQIYISLLFIFIAVSAKAQLSVETSKVVEKEWQGHTFSSDQFLLDNLENFNSVEEMITVFKKGELAFLSNNQQNVTVFLPMDSALESMKRREKKKFLEQVSSSDLKNLWKEYIIPGRIDSHSIRRNIENKNGSPIFVRTLGNHQLEFFLKNDELYLKDYQGNESKWIEGDFYFKNGFFHFIDQLLYYEE